jgi:hypothetical protein
VKRYESWITLNVVRDMLNVFSTMTCLKLHGSACPGARASSPRRPGMHAARKRGLPTRDALECTPPGSAGFQPATPWNARTLPGSAGFQPATPWNARTLPGSAGFQPATPWNARTLPGSAGFQPATPRHARRLGARASSPRRPGTHALCREVTLQRHDTLSV